MPASCWKSGGCAAPLVNDETPPNGSTYTVVGMSALVAAIRGAGATPHAVAIALDRQEKATENGVDVDHSAVQYVRDQLGLHVTAIATLDDLLQYLSSRADDELGAHRQGVLAYRARYGAG